MTDPIRLEDIVGVAHATHVTLFEAGDKISFWWGSPYTLVRHDMVAVQDHPMAMRISLDTRQATKATGPATGTVGPATLDLLAARPDIQLMDSDHEAAFALTIDGEFIGFSSRSRPGFGVPVGDLPRWRQLAEWADQQHGFLIGQSAAQWAADVIIALNQTGILP